MAGRGTPKPTRLKLVEGNPGGRDLTHRLKHEPMPPVGAKMPAGMSELAAAQWRVVAPKLTASRILTEVDAEALAAYCEVFARWRYCTDAIAKHGPMVKTASGGVKLSPMWIAMTQSTAEMRRFLVEFGMTPAGRARVDAVKEPGDDDPFADF